MKERIRYTNEPIELKPVKDFLPPPDRLVPKDETVKVTISLTRRSVAFFKKQARKHGTQYQKMVRNLLDLYVSKHM